MYGLGVDLGTTYTAAAVWRDGHTRMVPLGGRATPAPSAVYAAPGGSFVFGEVAVQRGRLDPDGLAVEFKRRIGDPQPLRLHGMPLAAEVLTAKLLDWVVNHVAGLEGGRPDVVTLTHPANWGPYRLEMLDEVARQAGLIAYRRLSEPEAAALHYASQSRVADDALIAVYDLGGGTFDATVLRKLPDRFEVVAEPEGMDKLGGIDFDDAVVDFVCRSLGAEIDGLDLDDRLVLRDLTRLRLDCIEAKEILSEDTEAVVPVAIGELRGEVRITRAEFEALIAPLVNLTMDAMSRALENAGGEAGAVSSILLVGGSSRTPLISRLLTARFGRPVAVDTHPKHSTALGAALVTTLDVEARPVSGPSRAGFERPDERLGGANPTRLSRGEYVPVARPDAGMRRREVAPDPSSPPPAGPTVRPHAVVPEPVAVPSAAPVEGHDRAEPRPGAGDTPLAPHATVDGRPDIPVPSLVDTSPADPVSVDTARAASELGTSVDVPVAAPTATATGEPLAPAGDRRPEATLGVQVTAERVDPAAGERARRTVEPGSMAARTLPLDSPPPGDTAAHSSPIAPRGRWGRESGVDRRDFRAGTDGRLYTEEFAAANAERARHAERAAALAHSQAVRRLQLAIGAAVVAVAALIVLVLAVLR